MLAPHPTWGLFSLLKMGQLNSIINPNIACWNQSGHLNRESTWHVIFKFTDFLPLKLEIITKEGENKINCQHSTHKINKSHQLRYYKKILPGVRCVQRYSWKKQKKGSYIQPARIVYNKETTNPSYHKKINKSSLPTKNSVTTKVSLVDIARLLRDFDKYSNWFLLGHLRVHMIFWCMCFGKYVCVYG